MGISKQFMGIAKQFMEQGGDGKVLLRVQEWPERALSVGGGILFKVYY